MNATRLFRKHLGTLAAGVLLAAAGTAAQEPPVSAPPRIAAAQMETRAGANLEREFRARVAAQAAPMWIGYAAPIVTGRYFSCCTADSCCGGCGLESRSQITYQSDEPRGVKLEGPRFLFVLFRIENRAVDRIRTFTEDCPLDAGGLPFLWFTDVAPAASVALLGSFAEAGEKDTTRDVRSLGSAATHAIAMHGDAAADTALERFASAGRNDWLRERAINGMGAREGRSFQALRRIAREDSNDRIRERAVQALSRIDDPAALDTVIEIARSDKSPQVRSRALMVLGHKAGARAVSTITSAIENDPETDVKRRALQALSQLPRDEGVPLLIHVARTNQNPVVRRQAMQYLGQSKDPRALKFFEEVLRQ